MTSDQAARVLREQTIPALRASGGSGHADAVEEVLTEAERTSRGLRDIEEAVTRAVERSKAGSPGLPAPLSEEITRLLLAILVIVQSKRGAATIQDSRIVPECPRCHARDALMVCCWRCASEGSPEQFNARIVPAPPPAEPA